MEELKPTNKLQWVDDIFYQKVASKIECESILGYIDEVNHLFEKGTIYRGNEGNVINDDLKITDEIILDDYISNPKVHQLYKQLEAQVVKFVGNILESEHPSVEYIKPMGLYNGRFRVKHYPKNEGKYGWHLDMGGEWSKRIFTVILYLNNVEEGGETEFSNQECFLKCEEGVMCAFPPYWNYPHRSVGNISHDKNILAIFIEAT